MAPARRRKPAAGRGVPRRVWEGRGGIVPGDVTHLDFIKGAVIREPERVNPGASGFSWCVPTTQVAILPPALKPEPSQASGHLVDLPLPARMTSLASWQLLLLLCVPTFGEPPAKVAPGPTGQGITPPLSRDIGYWLCLATQYILCMELRSLPHQLPREGQQPGPQELINAWEKGPRCAERKPGVAGLRARRTSPCPPVESSAGRQRPLCAAARSRLIPAPRGAVLVQREKDLSAYNWNSFGLRYGRRQAARAARAARG
ncbi:metastasis-suppressor KiSS-1 isoform X1 [Peromyscus californicus insignis]|uniref:metastasis-suppressor KiSS-1 isoform X1 n=1 Tax=Peromyscus californicus insignis TaxID=564181 RepID=UPI0022A77088|nr:metastasis-suppressor KiSS-1 isoform X1 [Peromyscus californicus insignis]